MYLTNASRRPPSENRLDPRVLRTAMYKQVPAPKHNTKIWTHSGVRMARLYVHGYFFARHWRRDS